MVDADLELVGLESPGEGRKISASHSWKMAPLGRSNRQHGRVVPVLAKALIFGVDGQDGSYLAEFLLEKGYQVIGWIPDSIHITYDNIRNIQSRITITRGDLADQESLNACLGIQAG